MSASRSSDPQFEGQTKQKLGNSEARGAVDSVVSEQLTYFLEQNPAVAKAICEKSVLAQRAREAARKARDLTRRKISPGRYGSSRQAGRLF